MEVKVFNTLFKNINELEPGKYLKFDIISKKYDIFTYWKLENTFKKNYKNSFCQSYLDGNIANKITKDHFNKRKDYSSLIWMMYSLERWHKVFF